MPSFTRLALAVSLLLPGSLRAEEGLPPPSTTSLSTRGQNALERQKTSAPAPGSNVATKFDPKIDGARFVNTGDYASRGDCLALSLLSIDAYARRMRGENPGHQSGLTDAYHQATAGNQQQRATGEWEKMYAGNPRVGWGDPSTGLKIWERLAAGEPMVIDFSSSAYRAAHAMVVYGYKDGKFLLYDPNYPGVTHTLEWDPVKGFGRFSQTGGFYDAPTDATAWRLSDFGSMGLADALRQACANQDRTCTDRYRPATIGLARDGTATIVTGTVGAVPAGLTPRFGGTPSTVEVYFNGRLVGSGPVQADGSYRVELPPSAYTGGPTVVEVVVRSSDRGLVGLGRQVVTGPLPAAPPRPRPSAPSRTPGFTGRMGGVGGKGD